MNCMALELPCAPIGHIFDMFSPRSLNTAAGRPVRCKFTGVYVPSSSTPRLTSWSKSAAQEFTDDSPPRYSKLDTTADSLQEATDTSEATSNDTVDLDTDSGHSSDSSVEEATADVKYIMPLASEAFEAVLMELKDEEEASKAATESDNSMSDCSDDSFDFGVHTVFSESPTLDRGLPRVVENECSQLCCREQTENSGEVSDSVDSESSEPCVTGRRVRFADHMRSSKRSLRASQKSNRVKASKPLKPILKSPSGVH